MQDELEYGEIIASGSYGQVRHVTWLKHPELKLVAKKAKVSTEMGRQRQDNVCAHCILLRKLGWSGTSLVYCGAIIIELLPA